MRGIFCPLKQAFPQETQTASSPTCFNKKQVSSFLGCGCLTTAQREPREQPILAPKAATNPTDAAANVAKSRPRLYMQPSREHLLHTHRAGTCTQGGDAQVRQPHVPGSRGWTGPPPPQPGTSGAGRTGSSVPAGTSVGRRPAAWKARIPRGSATRSLLALEDRPHRETGHSPPEQTQPHRKAVPREHTWAGAGAGCSGVNSTTEASPDLRLCC